MNEAKNRDTGLRQLLDRDITAYVVNTNIEWPGKAAVVVHQLHLVRGDWFGTCCLNGADVQTISADLSGMETWTPMKLTENSTRMFQGSILAGEGFKIRTETAQGLLLADSNYEMVLAPFIVGDAINSDPLGQPICWAICFWDWPEEKAKKFEEAYCIVESAVKPERHTRKTNGEYKYRDPQPQKWWQYGEKRPGLYHAIGRGHAFDRHPEGWVSDTRELTKVLAISTGITKYPAFTFLPTDLIYSNTLCLMADDRFEIFAVLSSDLHAVWAWAQRTTRQNNMESMRYAHGMIFETYPFPINMLQNGDRELGDVGKAFFENRQKFMEDNNAGLTKFYNDFHNPTKNDTVLTTLRCLQKDLNESVCQRYGWRDLDLACGFHEVGYLPDGKNLRFTISEEARQEVLHRLLKLNKTRYDEQVQNGTSPKTGGTREETIDGLAFEDGLFATENDKS